LLTNNLVVLVPLHPLSTPQGEILHRATQVQRTKYG